MYRLKNKKGFTIIEIIIVIAIIGMLAAIAVPKFKGFTERARVAADQATVRTLNNVTPLARVNLAGPDPFRDDAETAEDNEKLIELLVDGGYLDSVVEAQSKDAELVWENERWYLRSLSQGGVFLTLEDLYEQYLRKDDEYNAGVLGFRSEGHTRFQGLATEIFIPKEIDGQEIFGIYNNFFWLWERR